MILRFFIYSALVLGSCFLSGTNEHLNHYVDHRLQSVEFDGDWIRVDLLSSPVLAILKFAKTGKNLEPADLLFDELFFSEEMQLQIGVQNLRTKGFKLSSSPGETACMVFGCQYEIQLREMLEQEVLTQKEFTDLRGDAERIAHRKRFWNCLHSGFSHLN